jgi:hypothetical protein
VIRSLKLISLMTVALCAALLSSAFPASPPEVKVDIQATPQKATVGDPISIRLDISLPQSYQVILPKLGEQFGDFSILDFPPGKIMTAGQDGDQSVSQYQAQITVALFKTGEFEFPPIQVTLRGADGSESQVSSQPVKISIQSVLTEQDQDLKQLKKQAEIQEPVRWVMWLSIACLIIILAALAVWLWQRRRQPKLQPASQPDTDLIALAESDLRDLIRRGMLEEGLTKQFYVSLSDIIKRILEAGFQIQTLEKTTSEILEELKLAGDDKRPGQALDTIESVLTECDLVKFAKYIPSQPENNAAVESAFEILDLAKKMKQPATVEETPSVRGVS